MTYGENDEVLKNAIQNKDVAKIRNILITVIGLDPRFETKAIERDLEYLEGCYPELYNEICEPFKEMKAYGEKRLSRDAWDRQYFHTLIEWLRVNFAPDQRLAHIKEVGETVYPPIHTKPPMPGSTEHPNNQKHGKPTPKNAHSQYRVNSIPFLIAIAAVLTGIIFVIKALVSK